MARCRWFSLLLKKMLFQRRFVVREERGRGDLGAELLDLFLGCHQLALVLTLLSSYSFLKHLNYSSSFLLCLLACCFCSSHISSSFDDVFIGRGGCFKPRPRRAAARGRRLQSWCGARPRGRREKKKKGGRRCGVGVSLKLDVGNLVSVLVDDALILLLLFFLLLFRP